MNVSMPFDEAVDNIAFLMQDDGFMPTEAAIRMGREYAGRIFGPENGERVFAAACKKLGIEVPDYGRPN